MSRLEELVMLHKDDLDGEVFDYLVTLTDFEEFKDQMNAYKNSDQNRDIQIQGNRYK